MRSPAAAKSACLRYGVLSATTIATFVLGALTVWGIIVLNDYIRLQHGTDAALRESEADTLERLATLQAMDVTLAASITAGDASVLTILSAVNASLSNDVAYLTSLLNVTSGSAQTFIESVHALVTSGLADRLRSLNGVTGNNATEGPNVDLVSLSPALLTVTADTEAHTVSLTMANVVTTVTGTAPNTASGNLQVAGTGMIAITTDNDTSTVTVDGSAIVTVLTNLQAMDLTQESQLSDLNSTVVSLQSQLSSIQMAEATLSESLNGTITNVNVTLTDLIAQVLAANAAIAALQAQLANVTTIATPTGAIIPWSGAIATAPDGYLICDGASYDAATYPALFAVIGTMYGGGGGNFSVPDLRGRVPVGYKSSGTFNTAVGTDVGEETHVLTTSEMASHDHTATTSSSGSHNHGGSTGAYDATHTHGFHISTSNNGAYPDDSSVWDAGLGHGIGSVDKVGTNYVDFYARANTATLNHAHSVSSDGSHTHTLTSSSVGSDVGHNNIQPSLVLSSYVIKT